MIYKFYFYRSAVVSVQRPEQSNIPHQQQQQQQIAGAQQMVFPPQPIRYYSPDYMTQRMYIRSDLFCNLLS
jgi:hypothetical protein